MKKPWTEEEDLALQECSSVMDVAELAEGLGRKVKEVVARLIELDMRKQSKEEDCRAALAITEGKGGIEKVVIMEVEDSAIEPGDCFPEVSGQAVPRNDGQTMIKASSIEKPYYSGKGKPAGRMDKISAKYRDEGRVRLDIPELRLSVYCKSGDEEKTRAKYLGMQDLKRKVGRIRIS